MIYTGAEYLLKNNVEGDISSNAVEPAAQIICPGEVWPIALPQISSRHTGTLQSIAAELE